MSVPKQRHTKTRRDRKRKRFELKPIATQICPKCSKPMLPHHVCGACGFYRGKEIVDTLKKTKIKSEK